MKTVAVIEGFAGGPMHTRQFRKALSEAGFKVIKDRRQADIIIAHSAGIYSFPPDVKASLLVLIGPTYWPGRRLIKRVIRHVRVTKRYHVEKFGRSFYIRKKLLELYYFFRRHQYMWYGIFNNNNLDRLEKLASHPGRKTIIIRNQGDPFSSPAIENDLKAEGVKFVSLPGRVHDDYAADPEPYIDLLLKEV